MRCVIPVFPNAKPALELDLAIDTVVHRSTIIPHQKKIISTPDPSNKKIHLSILILRHPPHTGPSKKFYTRTPTTPQHTPHKNKKQDQCPKENVAVVKKIVKKPN